MSMRICIYIQFTSRAKSMSEDIPPVQTVQQLEAYLLAVRVLYVYTKTVRKLPTGLAINWA